MKQKLKVCSTVSLLIRSFTFGAAAWFCGDALAADAPAEKLELAPLPLKLPMRTLHSDGMVPLGPNIEPLSSKPRPPFLAPKGVTNVALGKKVTSSSDKVYNGTLQKITDGEKETFDEHAVEIRKGLQWVQIDLEQEYPIYAIVFWHDHRFLAVFHDVIVQASNDPDFKKGVRTLFNNDRDNSSGLGAGSDKEYFETIEGKLLDTKGIKSRNLRFYSNGSNLAQWNVYQEIEVYALPVVPR